MRDVSFYIAKRYFPLKDSKTIALILSLYLVIIFFFVSFAYFISSTIGLLSEEFLNKEILGSSILFYLFVVLLGLIQIGIVYSFRFIFDKLTEKRRLYLGIFIGLILILFGIFALINFNSEFAYLPISFGIYFIIIPLFHVLGKFNQLNGVNIIASITVLAMTIATGSLFVILSVFSGLENLNLQMMGNEHPDIKISSKSGKIITDIDDLTEKLNAKNYIDFYSKTIEEKVYINYENKQDIAYIKGVDANYSSVVPIDTLMVGGSYFEYDTPYEIISSAEIARKLQMYIDYERTARLYIPKPGTGLIASENEAFNSVVANPIGVMMSLNGNFDQHIFSPIGLTQILLELPENSAYYIEIKIKSGESPIQIKKELQRELGKNVVIETRQDLDSAFMKVMNIENLITYLIFTLVIIIASFNLAGAIIIIILDKKRQIKTLWSFGLTKRKIKRIFFETSLIITFSSLLFGILLGTILGLLQQKYSLVMANPFVAFPFVFSIKNYFTVIATVAGIGVFVSYLVSRRLPEIDS